MMRMLNIIRNEINAFHAMNTNSMQVYTPRFPLQMDLYRQDADDEFKIKLNM